MVAEVLAGIALVKASCEIISKTISAAKDISSVASEVDNLFEGSRQLQIEEKNARKSGQSVTEIVINQQLAAEQVSLCKELIIGRFGYYSWQTILQLQRDQRLEEKARAAAKKREREEKAELVSDVATVGASMFIGIAILLVTVLALVLAI
tara:strand:- start:243 stop:695 length:453 start_codon:yes stop_codon:yes gene_type:complete